MKKLVKLMKKMMKMVIMRLSPGRTKVSLRLTWNLGQPFVNRDQDREISHLVPPMRSGPGMMYLESRCRQRNHEWILISPVDETGTGPYLVPQMRPGTEILLQWSREWE